jgi:hypothetical protein
VRSQYLMVRRESLPCSSDRERRRCCLQSLQTL